MRSRRELEDILDRCLERLLAGEATVEECLESYPRHAAELEPLLRTAAHTSRAVGFRPDEEARARVRRALRLEMARDDMAREPSSPHEPRRWWRLPGWQPRWAMAVAVVMALFLAGGGTVLAADSSMPGNPLYSVKLATEKVRVALAGTDVSKAEVYARLADRRVAEMERLVEKGTPRQVRMAARLLGEHMEMIRRLSLAARVASALEQAQEPAGEPASKDKAPDADTAREPSAAHDGDQQPSATVLAPNGRARLKKLLDYYTASHLAKLRAVLEKAPASLKPAIQRAMAQTVAGYRRAADELRGTADDRNLPPED